MPRKTGKIQSNKTILLIVEGATEQIYFSEMKSTERIPGITVIPRMASHSSVYHILKIALSEQTSLVYDSVWCIFDYDTILQDGMTPEVKSMMQQAKALNIKFADSLPSFELWYLLHYVLPKQWYPNQAAVIQELQKYISGYEKTVRWLEHARLYAQLKPLHRVAMRNSSRVDLRNPEQSMTENCFCNVYKIFEEIDMES